MDILPIKTPQNTVARSRDDLKRAANELEAQFLAEMLKASGLGKTPETFGGSIGEDQFASVLAEQQAKQIVAAGGFGLSEAIFNSLVERNDE